MNHPDFNNWDLRFLELAKHIAQFSKDPSTKCGAVIIDRDRRIVSTGYNGFPRGVIDSEERYNNRELKYSMIVHCEINAIIFAQQSLKDCILYTYPFLCCSRCAGIVIQSGIGWCVAPALKGKRIERWGKDLEISRMMFDEAGVQVLESDFN